MVRQRYEVPSSLQTIISGQGLASQPPFEVEGLKVDYLFFLTCSLDFLRWECPRLDEKCQWPSTWNCHPQSLLIDYCQWRSNGASCIHAHTKPKQDSFLIFLFYFYPNISLLQSFTSSKWFGRHAAKKKLIYGTWLVENMPPEIQTSGAVKEIIPLNSLQTSQCLCIQTTCLSIPQRSKGLMQKGFVTIICALIHTVE